MTLSPHHQYLVDDQGKPFFWLADTWWYGLTDRCSDQTFISLIKDRVAKGFTVVMLVVGSPPEVPFNDPQGSCGGQLPWTKAGLPNPAYFTAVESRIRLLLRYGLIPCLVAGWGWQIQVTGPEKMWQFWQLMIDRFASYPVIWCLTGEVDLVSLPPRISTGFSRSLSASILKWSHHLPLKLRHTLSLIRHSLAWPRKQIQYQRQLQQWATIANNIKQSDSHHLLTVHPHRSVSAATLFHQPEWLDINTIQSGHAESQAAFLVETPLHEANQQPFINLEPWYEGIHHRFGPLWQRYAFWMSVLAGAKGHTYGADGLWNMRTATASFLNHWGNTPWQAAVDAPGSGQVGRAALWLKQHRWWTLRPDLACLTPAWSSSSPMLPLAGKMDSEQWICYFPDSRVVTKVRPRFPRPVTGQWYEPATMKPREKCQIQDQNPLLPSSSQSSDALLLVTALD